MQIWVPLRGRNCHVAWCDVKPIQVTWKINCIYDRYETIGGCIAFSSAGLGVFGLQLEIATDSAGKAALFFFFVSQQGGSVFTKEAPAVLPARLYFGSHLFPPARRTAVKPQMRGAILKKTHTWIGNYWQGEQPNNSFSTHFLFQCSPAS